MVLPKQYIHYLQKQQTFANKEIESPGLHSQTVLPQDVYSQIEVSNPVACNSEKNEYDLGEVDINQKNQNDEEILVSAKINHN